MKLVEPDMANRALAAKVERARRQAGELAAREYSKPFYSGNLTLGAAEAERIETAKLVAAFKGRVVRCPAGKYQAERVRGGFVNDRSSIAPSKFMGRGW